MSRPSCASGTAGLFLVIALASSCAPSEELAPRPTTSSHVGELAVEIHGRMDVTLTPESDGEAAISFSLGEIEGRRLFPLGTELSADGRQEAFPEAGTELFTAVVPVAADAASACGDAPITLALSLAHRLETQRFAGSLAAYCGEDAFGVPAALLRISGELSARP